MRTLQLVWFGVLCVNAQNNHFGNYSPATWLPGYLQVPCPHCENHMIQVSPVGVGLISTSVCAVYMWMDLYSLAVKYVFLCSQLDACKVYFSWMQVLVCAVWLTLTSLDRSLYVLVAQHPCKCHGPLWLPEGYTYTCMEEMQSDTKLNCWGRFLLPDSCNCQRKAGLVDRLSIIITYVGIFLIDQHSQKESWVGPFISRAGLYHFNNKVKLL